MGTKLVRRINPGVPPERFGVRAPSKWGNVGLLASIDSVGSHAYVSLRLGGMGGAVLVDLLACGGQETERYVENASGEAK